jgi:phosphosulfolactate phosphohydrolase-like enzyme
MQLIYQRKNEALTAPTPWSAPDVLTAGDRHGDTAPVLTFQNAPDDRIPARHHRPCGET